MTFGFLLFLPPVILFSLHVTASIQAQRKAQPERSDRLQRRVKRFYFLLRYLKTITTNLINKFFFC